MGVIRDDFDVDCASAVDLRAYVYDLEHALRAFEPDNGAERLGRLIGRFKRLSPTPARLLLHIADGRVRSKEALHLLLYADSPQDDPDIKIVDVFICKLRAAINGAPFSIRTIWGHGYQLIDTHRALKAFLEHGTEFEVDAEAPRPVLRPVPAPIKTAKLKSSQVLLLKVAEHYPLQPGTTGAWVQPMRAWRQTTQFSECVNTCERHGWITIHARGKQGKGGQWCLALTEVGIEKVEALRKAMTSGEVVSAPSLSGKPLAGAPR